MGRIPIQRWPSGIVTFPENGAIYKSPDWAIDGLRIQSEPKKSIRNVCIAWTFSEVMANTVC